MVVAIVGSRNCEGLSLGYVLENIPPGCTGIVSGGAPGVDMLAQEAARRLCVPFAEYRPDYKTFGRSAPLVRNHFIVEQADLVLAFWDYHSPGTRHVIQRALKLDKQVKIIMLDQEEETAWLLP